MSKVTQRYLWTELAPIHISNGKNVACYYTYEKMALISASTYCKAFRDRTLTDFFFFIRNEGKVGYSLGYVCSELAQELGEALSKSLS